MEVSDSLDVQTKTYFQVWTLQNFENEEQRRIFPEEFQLIYVTSYVVAENS